MNTVGDKLRSAREALGLSLEDIASVTRVNLKFLKAIEEGTGPDLPRPYVRAFIKAYAGEVGLDTDELLAELAPPPDARTTAGPRPPGPDAEDRPGRPAPEQERPAGQKQPKVVLALALFLVGGLVLLIALIKTEKTSQKVEEISFGEVVKEQEKQAQPAARPADSLTTESLPSVGRAAADSLFLVTVARESVWFSISVDGLPAHEYMFTPRRRMQWKAKTFFLLSLGNPRGLSLTLNGQNLVMPSKGPKPLANLRLSWDTLEKLQGHDAAKE